MSFAELDDVLASVASLSNIAAVPGRPMRVLARRRTRLRRAQFDAVRDGTAAIDDECGKAAAALATQEAASFDAIVFGWRVVARRLRRNKT